MFYRSDLYGSCSAVSGLEKADFHDDDEPRDEVEWVYVEENEDA